MRCRGREPHTAAIGALPRFRLLMGLTGLFLAVNVLSMAAPGAAVLCISRMLAALLWVLPRSVGAMERKEPFFRQFSVLRDRRCSNPGDRALRPFFSWRFDVRDEHALPDARHRTGGAGAPPRLHPVRVHAFGVL